MTVGDLDCTLGYFIVRDTLTLARYAISKMAFEGEKYITEYKNLKSLLQTKYGPPKTDTVVWHDTGYVHTGEIWVGMSVLNREFLKSNAAMSAEWALPRTFIHLYLDNDSTGLHFGIDYLGGQFMPMIEKAFQDRLMQNL
jgi:hypothetical protein